MKRRLLLGITVLLLLLSAIPLKSIGTGRLIGNYSFTCEAENSLTLVAVGNSDLYSGFIPARLYEKTGITGCIIAYPCQTPRQSYKLLRQCLKRQSPSVVLIETDMLYAKDNKTPAEHLQDAKRYLKSKQYTDDLARLWHRNGDADTAAHGYVYSEKTVLTQPQDYMHYSTDAAPITKRNLRYFHKLLALCRRRNITVILAELPSPASWSYARHNAVAQLAQENGLAFVDFNLGGCAVDYATDFRDNGNHLNVHGAEKITDALAPTLADRLRQSANA